MMKREKVSNEQLIANLKVVLATTLNEKDYNLIFKLAELSQSQHELMSVLSLAYGFDENGVLQVSNDKGAVD